MANYVDTVLSTDALSASNMNLWLGQLDTQIASNASDISTNTSDISTNTSNIAAKPDTYTDIVDYVMVSDRKAKGTDGGNASAQTWHVRDLNTEDADTGNIASLSSNRVSLPAGTYLCYIVTSGYEVGDAAAELYDYTNSTVLLHGMSVRVNNNGADGVNPVVAGRFVLSGTAELEVKMYAQAAKSGTGLGNATDINDSSGTARQEVYTIAQFWRIVSS